MLFEDFYLRERFLPARPARAIRIRREGSFRSARRALTQPRYTSAHTQTHVNVSLHSRELHFRRRHSPTHSPKKRESRREKPRGRSVDTTISDTYLRPTSMASLFLLHRTPTDPATITDRYAIFLSPFHAKFTAWECCSRTHPRRRDLIDT